MDRRDFDMWYEKNREALSQMSEEAKLRMAWLHGSKDGKSEEEGKYEGCCCESKEIG